MMLSYSKLFDEMDAIIDDQIDVQLAAHKVIENEHGSDVADKFYVKAAELYVACIQLELDIDGFIQFPEYYA